MRHRTANNKVAAQLISYLVDERGLTRTEIAGALGVDKSFVSRVRAAGRDLSTQQLDQLARHVKLPLGAMLIAAR